jgi:hypothetical protein
MSDTIKYARKDLQLTSEQITKPEMVLADFFSDYHLPEIHEEFWDVVKSAIIYKFSEAQQSSSVVKSIFFFHENIRQLIDASYLISEAFEQKLLIRKKSKKQN